MARRSRVTGVNSLRRKLRRVDPEITQRLRNVVRASLDAIQRDAQSLAPRDRGDLADSIEVLMSRDGLTGVVGPGVRAAERVRKQTGSEFGRTIQRGRRAGEKVSLSRRNKEALMQFYKGYWSEFGTKGSAEQGIPPQRPTPFMTPAFDMNENRTRRAVQAAINAALRRAASG